MYESTSAGPNAPSAAPDSPGVLVFPPILFFGSFWVGLLLHYLRPVQLASGAWLRVAGVLLAVTSGAVAAWGSRTMRRAGTNVLPSKPAHTIVTGGPFRFSRNPLYVASTCCYAGISLALNTLWPLVLLPPMLMVLHWGVIRREERYLEAKFGDAYRAYKARVRRWL